jgi:hypothetical protein
VGLSKLQDLKKKNRHGFNIKTYEEAWKAEQENSDYRSTTHPGCLCCVQGRTFDYAAQADTEQWNLIVRCSLANKNDVHVVVVVRLHIPFLELEETEIH